MDHVYPTATFYNGPINQWREDASQDKFFKLLKSYNDVIVVLLNGHEHVADFRFHSQESWFDRVNNCFKIPDNHPSFFLN